MFPDEEYPAYESPIDGLAGGLDTFATSDYDYAAHMREFSLDTLSAGPKSENAYKPYLYKNSCGKFMNTLLLLTLKRACCLETFRWNIRVELSRPVYRALHNIATLKKVHIRMQAGRSLHEQLPALPIGSASSPLHPSAVNPTPLAPFGAGSAGLHPGIMLDDEAVISMPTFGGGQSSLASVHYANSQHLLSLHKIAAQRAAARVPPRSRTGDKEPPTISGFKNLHTLSILDIDNLDIINELRSCVRNSSTTLRKLRLSFSDGLAALARRAPPHADSDDSDEDEFLQDVPAANPYDINGLDRQTTVLEERKRQESVLAKVFDVGLQSSALAAQAKKQQQHEQERLKGLQAASTSQDASQIAPDTTAPVDPSVVTKEPEQAYVEAIRMVTFILSERCQGTSRMTDEQRQEMLDTISTASKMYVEARTSKIKPLDDATIDTTAADATVADPSSSSSSSLRTGIQSAAAPTETVGSSSLQTSTQATDVASTSASTLVLTTPLAPAAAPPRIVVDDLGISMDNPNSDQGEDFDSVNGDDVDVEGNAQVATAGQEVTQSGNVGTHDMAVPSGSGSSTGISHDKLSSTTGAAHDAAPTVLAASTPTDSLFADPVARRLAKGKERASEVEVLSADQPATKSAPTEPAVDHIKASRDYNVQSRGMSLRELSLYLVPIRASVLTRSLDLHVLEKVNLLGVGNQIPFWTQLAKENKDKPLKLRRIFTDHVTPAFLQCVGQLERVDELLMLQRSSRHYSENFAPAQTTTIDQIRRLALRKHVNTLKRLMIKDSRTGSAWDVNVKTILLLCARGVKLEELAVSMSVQTVVSIGNSGPCKNPQRLPPSH